MKDWKLKFIKRFIEPSAVSNQATNDILDFIDNLLAEVRKEGEREVIAKFIAHMVNADIMADEIRDLMPEEYKKRYLEEINEK